MSNKVKKLSDLISAYSNKLQMFERSGALEIYSSWAAVVGEKIASHCKLIDIERQTAIIETDHTGWCQQLLLNKQRIIRNFQKQYPQLDVKNISVIVSSSLHYKDSKKTNSKTDIVSCEISNATEKGKNVFVLNNTPNNDNKLPYEVCNLLENLRISIIENEKK